MTSDFEVHIGMTQASDHTSIVAIPEVWKRDPVFSLSRIKGHQQYEQHNVDGQLRTLLTRHGKGIEQVKELVADASSHTRHDATCRIEIEQVLVSCDRSLERASPAEVPFRPTRAAFPNLILIPETPPYEVQYCLSWEDEADKPSGEQVTQVCRTADVGIDEIVEFGGDAKITTTKFYRRLDRMMDELDSDATKFLAALAASSLNVRFRLIAERIIACGIPV